MTDNAETGRGLAVQAKSGIGIFRPFLDACDVAETDEIAVRTASDDKATELIGSRERPFDAEGDVLLLGFQAPGRKLDILGAKRALDVTGRQAEGGQALRLEPDPHRRSGVAANEDARHAVERGETVDEVAIDIVAELEARPAGFRHHDEHDWR